MTLRRRIPRLRSNNGQTAVEFAMVAPLLIVLLLGIAEVGIAFNHYLTVTDAARAGARKAVTLRFGGTVDDVKQTVRKAAGGLNTSKLAIDVTAPSWTHGQDVTVTVKYPYDINLLGWVVASGDVTSTMKERIE